jgi:hypothetical protein
MRAFPRFARLLVLIGIVSVAVAAAPGVALAEKVKATLTFADGTGKPAPIRRATVEIWRKYGGIPVWHNDFTVTTDEQGRIDFTVPPSAWLGPGAVYGLRVYATNDAAIVRFRDRPQDAMYSQPGPPGAEKQLPSYSQSDVIDLSWDFTDLATVAYYNAADALLYGRDYALAHQAEPAIIKQVTVMPQSATTFYDPYVHWLRINPGFMFSLDDLTILHEYGHFLEEQLSTFGPAFASIHDGCNVQLGNGGAHAESMDFAWMEGWSGYFAQAVARAYNTTTRKITGPTPPTTTTGTPPLSTVESPSCPGTDPLLPREFLENFVAGALWDLVDKPGDPGAKLEPADRLCDRDDVIFKIFDFELQRHPANIQSFTDAWIARGLDFPPLRSTFAAQGVTVTGPPALTYYSPSAAADPAVWRGSEGGAWYIYGRWGPQWGAPGDIPVPADYDGDGQTDAAIWRPGTGEWWVQLSASGGIPQVTQWGSSTDIPLPGDYDGDGDTDFAYYRPSQNAVLVQNDSCGDPLTINLSAWAIGPGTPVVGDVDGDGRDDPGTYNAATGYMTMLVDFTTPFQSPWPKGKALAPNAVPAIADYDADGADDLATYTPTKKSLFPGGGTVGGAWTIWKSTDGAIITPTWGGTLADNPVPADYDGDGTADLAVYNGRTGNWTIRQANGTPRVVQWGQLNDIPIPR